MSPRDHGNDETPPLAPPAGPAGTLPRKVAVPSLWLLTAMTGLGPFSMQILIPALPVLVRDLAAPPGQVGLVLTLYLTGIALGQLIYGPLSDRYGRRPVLLAGLWIYLGASVLAAVAPSLGFLLAARVLQAIGACSGMVLGRAIVRDVWPREQAASRLGYVMMGMTVAPMLAPVVGALVEEAFGWRAILIACLVFGAGLLWATARRLPETLAVPRALPGFGGALMGYLQVLRAPDFRALGAVSACSSGVFFAFMAGAPFAVVNGMGHSPRTYGLAFMVVSGGFGLGSWVAARWSARLGTLRMLGLGLSLTTAGGLLAVLVQSTLPLHLAGFFGPMVLVALGNGISMPNSVAAAVGARPGLAGTASGLLGAMQMGFGALMTVVVGLMERGAGLATVLTMLGCALGAQLALRGARRALRTG